MARSQVLSYAKTIEMFRFSRDPVAFPALSRVFEPDVFDAGSALPFFDASPVVVYRYEMDCDGPSESWTLHHGTVFWRDQDVPSGDGSLIPLSQCPAGLDWTYLGSAMDYDSCEGISYASTFYPAPWVADDSLGTVLDHTNEEEYR